jgi:hypothetical protein
MENQIKINSKYNSLEKLLDLLKKETNFNCSKEYDIWEIRTTVKDQMEECIVVKKSKMHAIKIFFIDDCSVKLTYIIPNKMMNVYFGKSVEARRNIFEIITGSIKKAIFAGAQKKAYDQLEKKIREVIS